MGSSFSAIARVVKMLMAASSQLLTLVSGVLGVGLKMDAIVAEEAAELGRRASS